MKTRWDNVEAPSDWTAAERDALQKFRELCEQQSLNPGGLKGYAISLGYPKSDSLYQILRATQKVGEKLLKRMLEAGYEADYLFPSHEYIQNRARSASEVYLPELVLGVAAKNPDQVNEPQQKYGANQGAKIFARPDDIPEQAFFVRANDDPKQRVVWVCDPNFEGDTGNRPLIVETPKGMAAVKANDINMKQRVIAVVILETIEVHSKQMS